MSTAETAPVPKSQRRRRSSVGGLKQKLAAPQRKGFVRRWVDDDPSRIMELEELGYTLASDRAGEGDARTDGLGSRITRHAGKRENGQPHHLVLMECREDDYAQGTAEKEEALKPFEEAIRAGADTTGRLQDSYVPKSGRSAIKHTG